jgi:hypothetical protein
MTIFDIIRQAVRTNIAYSRARLHRQEAPQQGIIRKIIEKYTPTPKGIIRRSVRQQQAQARKSTPQSNRRKTLGGRGGTRTYSSSSKRASGASSSFKQRLIEIKQKTTLPSLAETYSRLQETIVLNLTPKKYKPEVLAALTQKEAIQSKVKHLYAEQRQIQQKAEVLQKQAQAEKQQLEALRKKIQNIEQKGRITRVEYQQYQKLVREYNTKVNQYNEKYSKQYEQLKQQAEKINKKAEQIKQEIQKFNTEQKRIAMAHAENKAKFAKQAHRAYATTFKQAMQKGKKAPQQALSPKERELATLDIYDIEPSEPTTFYPEVTEIKPGQAIIPDQPVPVFSVRPGSIVSAPKLKKREALLHELATEHRLKQAFKPEAYVEPMAWGTGTGAAFGAFSGGVVGAAAGAAAGAAIGAGSRFIGDITIVTTRSPELAAATEFGSFFGLGVAGSKVASRLAQRTLKGIELEPEYVAFARTTKGKTVLDAYSLGKTPATLRYSLFGKQLKKTVELQDLHLRIETEPYNIPKTLPQEFTLIKGYTAKEPKVLIGEAAEEFRKPMLAEIKGSFKLGIGKTMRIKAQQVTRGYSPVFEPKYLRIESKELTKELIEYPGAVSGQTQIGTFGGRFYYKSEIIYGARKDVQFLGKAFTKSKVKLYLFGKKAPLAVKSTVKADILGITERAPLIQRSGKSMKEWAESYSKTFGKGKTAVKARLPAVEVQIAKQESALPKPLALVPEATIGKAIAKEATKLRIFALPNKAILVITQRRKTLLIPKFKTLSTIKQKPTEITKTRLFEKTLPKQLQAGMIKTIQIPKIKALEFLKSMSAQIPKASVFEAQVPASAQIQAVKIRTPELTKMKLPKLALPPLITPISFALPFEAFSLRMPELGKRKTRTKSKKPGYNVFVKIRGRFVKVNKQALPKETAQALGAYIADKSSVATFKIAEAKKPAVKIQKSASNLFKFYEKKGKKDTFVEKPAFRIDSPREFKEITLKGIEALRKKFYAKSKRVR